VNTVWVYPRCRVATRRGVDLRRRQFERAVTQRVGEQAAVCKEWGGEGEEGDPCMGVALVNDGPVTVLLEV
jgi:D-Tyr-tRNAtyr deacylase